MSKNLCLAVLLALAVAVGAWCAFGRDAGASMPRDIAPPKPEPTSEAPAGPHTVGGHDGTAPQAGTVDETANRSAPEGLVAVDDRACVLEVAVVSGERVSAAGQPADGVPYVEVVAWLVDEPGLRQRARTDALGRCRLTFVGAHAEQVHVQSGVGGRAEALLRADRAQSATIHVPTRAIVRGRVVDAAGLGIEGADVELLRWPDEANATAELWRVGRSGRDGAFELHSAAGGRLGATHPTHAPSDFYLVRAARAGAPPETLSLELVLGKGAATVFGIVRGTDGIPVHDAEIELRPIGKASRGAELRAPPRRASGGEDGTFAIDRLPPGPIEWTARAAGHGWHAGSLELMPGRHTPLEIRLPRPAQVHGQTRTGDGSPAQGALVTAGVPGTLAFAATRARADGSYTLDDLGSGDVRLEATLGSARDAKELTLPDGGTAIWHPVLAKAHQVVELVGRVVDTQDRPLGGWQIVVRGAHAAPDRLVTAADGTFRAPVETPVGLDVRAYAPDRDITSFADAVQRGVDVKQGPVRLVVRDGARSMVRGRLTASGAAPAGARIDVWHHERREHARHRALDDGTIAFDAPTGSIDVTVELARHVPMRVRDVQVTAGVVTDLGMLQLELGGGLFGTLLDTNGRAIEGCELSILPSRSGTERIVGECVGGSYHFPPLPAGEHTLQAQAPGHAAWSWTVRILPGEQLEQPIELHPGVTRRLRVVVPPGAGDNVWLLLRPVGGAARWASNAKVDRPSPEQHGIAEFAASMAQGTFEAHASTRSGFTAFATVTFATDGEAPVQLRLSR